MSEEEYEEDQGPHITEEEFNTAQENSIREQFCYKCYICGDDADGSTKVGANIICSKGECMSEAITGNKPIPIEDLLANALTIAELCEWYKCTDEELRAALSADCVKEQVQEQIEFNRSRRK